MKNCFVYSMCSEIGCLVINDLLPLLIIISLQYKAAEKGMAIHSSILVWRIPWTEETGWVIVHGVRESRT